MSTVDLKLNHKGIEECLDGFTGNVQAAGEGIAVRASSHVTKGSGFHVEMTNEPRYMDSAYGVTRPVAYVVADDEESAAEEAEDKILSKAVM